MKYTKTVPRECMGKDCQRKVQASEEQMLVLCDSCRKKILTCR